MFMSLMGGIIGAVEISFQDDIQRYLKDETLPLAQRALLGRIGVPTERRTIYIARRWHAPKPSLMAEVIGPARAPVTTSKDPEPVDAWEPRICEDGVIIRGPPSEDTPPPKSIKE